MAMENIHDYFRLRCSQMLAAEQDVMKIYGYMSDEVGDPRLKRLLIDHQQPIKQQIANLEKVVDNAGGPSLELEGFWQRISGMEDRGTAFTRAVMRDHDLFRGTSPEPMLTDINNAVEADTLSHYEIAHYTALIVLAKQLGLNDSAAMLQQNIDMEVEMRTALDQVLPILVREGSIGGQMAA